MKKIGWVLGLVLLCGLGVGARAQGDPELSKGWTFRGGFFVPERQISRQKEGDIWLTLGAERPFYEGERYTGTFSIDYYGSGGIYNIPFQVNLRSETNRLRYGAGVGVGIGHDATKGASSLAYNLQLGYVVRPGSSPITFDVRYLGTGGSSGQLNGWGFLLGLTF